MNDTTSVPHVLRLSAYGVALEITVAHPDLHAVLAPFLPPGHEPTEQEPVASFVLADERQVGALDAALRGCIAAHAPAHVFVHAGVVGRGDRVLVLPGGTHAGKSELVAALVAAGAAYGSDEFAVLGPDGLVHPYPRPLSLRRPRPRDVPAARLGAPVLDAPRPAGAIVFTHFVAGAAWSPRPLTSAEGALRLLEHAGQARAEPDRVLAALQAMSAAAVILEGPRGEAAEVAPALLALLEPDPSSGPR